MASKKEEEPPFGGTYLLLKPKEATLLDLLHLLFSSNLKERPFIDCPIDLEVREFRQRWLLFISIIAQKVLFTSGKSMKYVGDLLEFWLNRVESNGGVLGLFINKIKGKVITPERSSATFKSVAGFLDSRVDLEKSIIIKDNDNNNNNAKYKSLLSMMACKFSYENEEYIANAVQNHWDMEFVGLQSFWNDFQELWSTQALIVQDTKSNPNLIVVAFRGTEPFNADQWRTDMDLSWYEIPNVGKIHSGFMKALGLQKNGWWPKEIDQTNNNNSITSNGEQKKYAYYTIRDELKAMLHENGDAKFILAGHSLGGALAILFASVLTFHEEAWLLDKLEGVYTFGQPRVGDQKFGEFMKDKLRKYDVNYRRYVYCNDMVPRVPYDDKTLFFKHFGPCLYFNSLYQGQVLEEEPNKNYFSLFWVIPKILNAFWELVRGFLFPIIFRGKDYKETWLMTLFRFVGLIIPGISAHLPPDYVNVTKLGSLHGLQDLPDSQDSKND